MILSNTNDLDTPLVDPTPTRRTFLKTGIYAVAAGAGLVIAVPTMGYFIAPATNKEGSAIKVAVGKVADLSNQTELKTVMLRDITYTDTFKPSTINRKVFVRALKPNASQPEDFLVLDSTCTHAGCSVDYRVSTKDIFCGCHGSYYDQDGKNIKGLLRARWAVTK